ncbi:hypothetical protein CVT25_009294 [Psilocybe cyanescens]|uniref:Protein kinase domain-containing protein n=1 Tax=Psilocybe cyanescens TaxID=93625 RepID=A0A409WW42_PSICY|nr:hypothetical protein CVT25_009294 [Psilocybe cyanescens]
MALPQSFSTTADCPFMEHSSSTATVKLSSSSNPTSPMLSRSVAFPAGIEWQTRARSQTESGQNMNLPSSPTMRSRLSPIRMTQSGSFASLLMSVRSRSRSKAGDIHRLSSASDVQTVEPPTSWFGKACNLIRPWEDNEDEDIPEEQKQAYIQTREAVNATMKRMVGYAGEIALEVLVTSIELMEYAPVPALQGLSKTFMGIWKTVQQVSMNRLAFLRLTQTCTTILDSICNEVEGADEYVARQLSGPILVLERSFDSFLSLVKSQVETPFLARYLKREDTTRAIASCNDSLLRALTLFTTTIQIRTYQAVCTNMQMCADNHTQMLALMDHGFKIHSDGSGISMTTEQAKRCSAPDLDGLPSSSSHRSFELSASPTIVSRSTDDLLSRPQIMPILQKIQTAQNVQDAKADMEDLRQSIKAALESGNDAKLLSFLGIEAEEMPEAIKTLQRTLEKRSDTGDNGTKDTLHEEFIESGIDALRRMSAGNQFSTNLPFWTITKYELERKRKIGMGFFSEVFQGTWKGRVVAIKVLSEVTPSDLFVRETKVWKSLVHPNVLKLYGASSATGSHPWFFVSPYMKHGNLVEFLRRISQRDENELQGLGSIAENLPSSKSRGSYGKSFIRILKLADVYRILQEIAKGMEYLHQMNVLHGDLKASNVLVDDHCRCVISDFGQSEMKSEVCRITGSSMQAGTLRWKAPELLEGSSMLTTATDIYAYGVLCIEVLTMGDLPWAHDDDDDVRYNVLEKDKRPLIPEDFTSPLLHELVHVCWARDPAKRPSFAGTVSRLQRLRVIAGDGLDPSVIVEDELPPLSPNLSSTCLSPSIMCKSADSLMSFESAHSVIGAVAPTPTPHSNHGEHFDDSEDYVALPSAQEVDALRMEDVKSLDGPGTIPEPVHQKSSVNSKRHSQAQTRDENDLSFSSEYGERLSPGPANSTFLEARNERRYRYLLEHDYNSSLTLPLWTPSPVQIGDVGYLLKPTGSFFTLFNALQRSKTPGGLTGGFPSMAGYGNISKGHLRLDKRNVAQKGLDAFTGLLAFRTKNDMPIVRHHSFRLRAGHKSAHIYTESAEYHYMKKLEAPRAWFRANADLISSFYGKAHSIQKEDLLLVISLLEAPNYALFVNHEHPDGQGHFSVFSAPRKGHPWGKFTTDTTTFADGRKGPSDDAKEGKVDACKVSRVNEPPKAVLIGRLRFKPDCVEPTTAK